MPDAPALCENLADASSENLPAKPDKPWLFQPGCAPGPGRPKGSKSFEKALSSAAPKLAQAYVRKALKGSAPVLIDARKVFMPDDPASVPPSSLTVVVVEALRNA